MRVQAPLPAILLLSMVFTGCFQDESGDVTADFEVVIEGNTVSFDAANSTGPIAEYHWNFGDGATGSGLRRGAKVDTPA